MGAFVLYIKIAIDLNLPVCHQVHWTQMTGQGATCQLLPNRISSSILDRIILHGLWDQESHGTSIYPTEETVLAAPLTKPPLEDLRYL